MIFFKGKMKFGIVNVPFGHYFDECEARNFISSLNDNLKEKNKDTSIIFVECGNNNFHTNSKLLKKSESETNQSFDEIMDEILNEDAKAKDNKKVMAQIRNFKSNKINRNKFINQNVLYSFDAQYLVRCNNNDAKIEDVQKIVADLVYSSKKFHFSRNDLLILSNKIVPKKYIEVFDELIYKNKSALCTFCNGLIDDHEVSILSNSFFTCDVKKNAITERKQGQDEIINSNESLCKYNALKEEIERAFKVGDNNSIQGVNYLFSEDDTHQRRNAYKVLAETLYSVGRISEPCYYIVEMDVNERQFDSMALYLKNRIKMTQNSLYFFEFYKKNKQDDLFASSDYSNTKGVNGFLNTLKNSQYLISFGIYAEEDAKQYSYELQDGEINEKFSLVVFDGKLNKEAQLEYCDNKLKLINQYDLMPVLAEIIECQSIENDGLTSSELDDLINRVLKGKYEKIFKPVYRKVTTELKNGNITEKLYNMVGLKNLKSAVSELRNRISFKDLNEALVPATKILNKASLIERNNWILTGEPGSGKSTAAEILEKVMYQEKIIKKDLIVKYTPSVEDEDSGSFMDIFGQRNVSTIKDSFSQAIGGVLIVDEIGHLSANDKSLLLQLMEENKKDVAVILCGYESEAKELLDYNPGFRSRFTHIIKMENYTTSELLEVLNRKLKEKQFYIKDSVMDAVKELINSARQIKNFGQVRFIESFADKIISIHASRKLSMIESIMKEKKNIKIDDKEIYEIDKNDIDAISLEDMLGDEFAYVKRHGNPHTELSNLIGCKDAKSAINEFLAKLEIDTLKIKKKFISKSEFNMNMVFYGSPGTAKTTVARLVARILYDKGIITSPTVLEVGSSDLIGQYVGHTTLKVAKIFEKARGGVLFIDEAYSLANKEAGGFNQEAIDTIIKEMENCRANTMVIFAGYKKPMEEFIKCNPGFKSRVSKYVDFANYTKEELVLIFEKLANDMGYRLDKEERDEILKYVGKVLEEKMVEEDFGNGRVCRTIVEEGINKQSQRLVEVGIGNIKDEDLMTLKLSDFKAKYVDFYNKGNVIGFNVA